MAKDKVKTLIATLTPSGEVANITSEEVTELQKLYHERTALAELAATTDMEKVYVRYITAHTKYMNYGENLASKYVPRVLQPGVKFNWSCDFANSTLTVTFEN